MTRAPTLDRDLLAGPTIEAARRLVGALLVRDADGATARRSGRIVEVEAYVGEADRASHARFGRTARNAVMYGPPGFAYVYLVYGMHDCLNVVTEPAGQPAAVLVRAVQPVEGLSAMRTARHQREARRARGPDEERRLQARVDATPTERLARGPGLVCAAFDVTRRDDGLDLLDPASPLRIEAGEPLPVAQTPRIGIDYAPEPWRSAPWRFVATSVPGPVLAREDLPG